MKFNIFDMFGELVNAEYTARDANAWIIEQNGPGRFHDFYYEEVPNER